MENDIWCQCVGPRYMCIHVNTTVGKKGVSTELALLTFHPQHSIRHFSHSEHSDVT